MLDGYMWAKVKAAQGEAPSQKAAHLLLLMGEEMNMDDAYTGTLSDLAQVSVMSVEEVLETLLELQNAGLVEHLGDYRDPLGRPGVKLLIERCENGTVKDLPWNAGCE